MEAAEYLKEVKRLCKSFSGCKGCPLIKNDMECTKGDVTAVPIVEKWSKEHPRRKRIEEFISIFPNAPVNAKGIPLACCKNLGYCNICYNGQINCENCWNQPVEEEYLL